MFTGALSIIAVLLALVALAEWLERNTWMRHLGTALIVIVMTALVANLGVIPTYGDETPVYGAIFGYVAPVGIFWLLLLVDLRSLARVGGPSVALFLVGALGTTLGVVAGHAVVGGEGAFGPLHGALAGMFTGTYTGGGANFNAIALEYKVVEDGALYAGAAAVDNAMTTVWMIACVALPRLLAPLWPARGLRGDEPAAAHAPGEVSETIGVLDVALLTMLGVGGVALSGYLAGEIESRTGFAIPSTLILTTIALLLAQTRFVQRLRGARALGLFAVYLFLAVIGTLCDVQALIRIGELAPALTVFVCVLVAVHGLMVFGTARLFKMDLDTAAVASQANIGGSTSALALARSLGRGDLELPAILVGSVGLALGNYLGFLVAGLYGA